MKLPYPENATIDEQKLAGYSLNPNHSEGKHKARVFVSAFYLTLENLDELKEALLFAVKTYDAIPDQTNAYRQKYIIDFPLTGENKTATIPQCLDN